MQMPLIRWPGLGMACAGLRWPRACMAAVADLVARHSAKHRILLLQMRPGKDKPGKRMLQGIVVAVLTIGTMFSLSYGLGRCVDVPAWKERNYGFTFHCTNGAQFADHALSASLAPSMTLMLHSGRACLQRAGPRLGILWCDSAVQCTATGDTGSSRPVCTQLLAPACRASGLMRRTPELQLTCERQATGPAAQRPDH